MRELIIKMSDNIGSLCSFLKNKKNIDYLNYLNSNVPVEILNRNLSEKIYYFINKIDIPILCICGKHKAFIGFKDGYRITCGDKVCYVECRKKTCLEKYGVDNPKKSKDILESEKVKILEKWDGEHYMCNKSVREKFKKTMKENWGVEWAQQSKEISEKSKSTFNKNPNREEIILNRVIKFINKSENEKQLILNKKRKTIIENWGSVEFLYKHISNGIKEKSILNFGVNHHFSHQDIIKKRVDSYQRTITNKIISKLPKTIIYVNRKLNNVKNDNIIVLKCLECNREFEINRQYLVSRLSINEEICLNCNPIIHGKSGMELKLLSFIKDNYIGEILSNIQSIIKGELDIYIPELKLAFEFNGLYWHSELYKERNYHLNKTKECEKLGIQLIHIWEDDWVYKQYIIKSMILNKLGKSKRIFARKCEIKEISDNKLIREFLNENHIQGFVGSKIKLGLYYDKKLVSLMTFGNLRKSLGQNSSENTYELLRFCNSLNTSVVGGSSKLLKYFVNNYKPKEIISYSDNSRSSGNMYEKLGFKLIHNSIPNYYYIIDGIRNHRFNFRKDKLIRQGFDPNKTEIQIMNERGFFRIFDCGAKKWNLVY